MDEYLSNLKNKYNYSDEMINLISELMISFVKVLGSEYQDKILETFNNVQIFTYDNIDEASTKLTEIFNTGKKYRVGRPATGTGFIENEVVINENGIQEQKLVIGYSNNNVHALVHELCHAIAYDYAIEDNVLKTITGVDRTDYNISDNIKGSIISEEGTMFNELLTENLAIQVLDVYDKSVVHEPENYAAAANDLKNIFRNDFVNKAIIDSYMKHNFEFLDLIPELISEEEYKNTIAGLYQYFPNEEDKPYIEYLNQLQELSVKEFFERYIEYISQIIRNKYGIDQEIFSTFNQINRKIVSDCGANLLERSER